mmetsp:Transcript_1033/g.2114  ORF Transcript_1033/g.2114 Transcript_1033/m.2114 type:complete len:216 (-) Transcript_1033:322-969(-)
MISASTSALPVRGGPPAAAGVVAEAARDAAADLSPPCAAALPGEPHACLEAASLQAAPPAPLAPVTSAAASERPCVAHQFSKSCCSLRRLCSSMSCRCSICDLSSRSRANPSLYDRFSSSILALSASSCALSPPPSEPVSSPIARSRRAASIWPLRLLMAAREPLTLSPRDFASSYFSLSCALFSSITWFFLYDLRKLSKASFRAMSSCASAVPS